MPHVSGFVVVVAGMSLFDIPTWAVVLGVALYIVSTVIILFNIHD